jgi:hypothetical protein
MRLEHERKMEGYTEEKIEIVSILLCRTSPSREAKTTTAASARAATRTI